MKQRHLLVLFALLLVLTACVRDQPQIIVITATFPSQVVEVVPADYTPPPVPLVPLALSPVPDTPVTNPTLDVVSGQTVELATEHTVQPGDTLFEIAQKYGASLESLLAVNNITDANIIAVGQVIKLPPAPSQTTPIFKIIPDSRLVRAPGSKVFDIVGFIATQPGYIRQATDEVGTRQANGAELKLTLTAAQVVERVALEYSVDPRLLLAILEYRAGWLSKPQLSPEQITHPLIAIANSGGIDRSGLYRQLAWAANELNRGYYAWKTRGLKLLEMTDGTRLTYGSGLNAGTIGVQYFLALNNIKAIWERDVSQNGLYRTYYAYFGDPFLQAVDPLVPITLEQPPLTLPFAAGKIWYFTGGPHGGWNGGSAWAALDFAPPDERTAETPFCYSSKYPVTAVAPGIIARSGDGAVILDLDNDADESTGWTIFYLHLTDVIAPGTQVNVGDILGYSSCAGGFSTATHLHIARRFNGEWLPADCSQCIPGHERPAFVMSGWRTLGIANAEYQGFLENGTTQLQAEQGRNNPINQISW